MAPESSLGKSCGCWQVSRDTCGGCRQWPTRQRTAKVPKYDNLNVHSGVAPLVLSMRGLEHNIMGNALPFREMIKRSNGDKEVLEQDEGPVAATREPHPRSGVSLHNLSLLEGRPCTFAPAGAWSGRRLGCGEDWAE